MERQLAGNEGALLTPTPQQSGETMALEYLEYLEYLVVLPVQTYSGVQQTSGSLAELLGGGR